MASSSRPAVSFGERTGKSYFWRGRLGLTQWLESCLGRGLGLTGGEEGWFWAGGGGVTGAKFLLAARVLGEKAYFSRELRKILSRFWFLEAGRGRV